MRPFKTIFDARPGWTSLVEVLTRSGTKVCRRAFIAAAACICATASDRREPGQGGMLSTRRAMFTRKVSGSGGKAS